jgi:lipoyl(octanoyl) transferase
MSSAPDLSIVSGEPRSFAVEWLGRVGYADGLEIQREAVEAIRSGVAGDRLLLMEHPAVITLGRSADRAHVLESDASLAARGIDVFTVPRGGDVTYHAPGQLVGYLIRDLRADGEPDLHRFLRDIEAALIEAVAEFGLQAFTVPGKTGVYLPAPAPEPRLENPESEAGRLHKLASIGLGVRHWISHQGFALNVDLDLAGFDAIVPCGLADVVMTSLAEAAQDLSPELASRARSAVARAFTRRFGSLDPRD